MTPPVHYCNDCDCYPCVCEPEDPRDADEAAFDRAAAKEFPVFVPEEDS